MPVVCQIFLDRTRDGVHRSGEPVRGTLVYSVDKPTKFDSIYINFIGKGKCRWSESDGDNTTFYGNKEEYVNQSCNVLHSRSDKKIPAGRYEFPFQFFLPHEIPSSIKNKTCTIEYKIVAEFVKAKFFNATSKFNAEITVYAYVDRTCVEPLHFGLHKDLFSLTSNNKVIVKAVLDKTVAAPGENLTLKLTINNDSGLVIVIKTQLYRYFTYISSSKRKKVDKDSVKETASARTIKERSVSNLMFTIPILPSLYSIQHTKIMTGEYKVRVTADLPFPHINEVVEVPVVIGERRDRVGPEIMVLNEKPSSTKEDKGESKYDDNWDKLRIS
ncbi:arrestin domain-containing protein 2-like [Spodoptera litura]|uniref:Arrestin domain-containing protein 2-like n=1 Tax=Spodoptera litura TaxID=69820 RepID=A0A9J7DRA2_SPOLT|nr:arrestin domain-containing protein 2-like [Spodoptera litura]